MDRGSIYRELEALPSQLLVRDAASLLHIMPLDFGTAHGRYLLRRYNCRASYGSEETPRALVQLIPFWSLTVGSALIRPFPIDSVHHY